jgi:hypothetical protein
MGIWILIGNNQWEIWISLQATINGPNFPLIVACSEIQIAH